MSNRWTAEAAAAERLQAWLETHPVAATDDDRRLIDADLLPGGHLASSDDDPYGREADRAADLWERRQDAPWADPWEAA